ncbi:hypothetical protein OS493_029336 [Desmophyllum pertusum]|uniref:SWIM-type domain-containing protein n=1 Tax=Desmophyllum pertusum TaxID=174260 RepID=A0A9W9Z9P9_9CNID|nr:hypothetical protein OS493_029336 [Desmophyllum pertusum]
MTDKPMKTGRKYVDSGFVHDMMDTVNADHYLVRAHVWPSMRTELPHNVIVVTSVNSGAVLHASCEPCWASSLGRCSHVVAVLFSVLDYVQDHGPVLAQHCTSQECSWNKGKKRNKNPRRVSQAKYPSKKRQATLPVIDFDPRPANKREVKVHHINNFLSNIQALSQEDGGLSMWETQLQFTYYDYDLQCDRNSLLLEQILSQKELTSLPYQAEPVTMSVNGPQNKDSDMEVEVTPVNSSRWTKEETLVLLGLWGEHSYLSKKGKICTCTCEWKKIGEKYDRRMAHSAHGPLMKDMADEYIKHIALFSPDGIIECVFSDDTKKGRTQQKTGGVGCEVKGGNILKMDAGRMQGGKIMKVDASRVEGGKSAEDDDGCQSRGRRQDGLLDGCVVILVGTTAGHCVPAFIMTSGQDTRCHVCMSMLWHKREVNLLTKTHKIIILQNAFSYKEHLASSCGI